MKYWLTTHWPRQQGIPTSEPYADVWVKDGQWDVIKQLAPEDLVFIYQSRSGPLPLGHNEQQLIDLLKTFGPSGKTNLTR
jgi:hypothetical protein